MKKTYTIPTKETTTIIIENKAIVDTFVMWFAQMWSSLK